MSTVTAVPLRPLKRGIVMWIWIGVALALIGAAALAFQGDDFMARNARAKGVVSTASGLQYKLIQAGPAGAAKPTDTDVVLVQYKGTLLNGTVFDQSQRPTPFPVTGVVPGFSEALKLMPKGSKYRFWIKPELGYGAETKGPIPANSTLVFDVELLDFIPEQVLRQMQMQQGALGGAPGGAVPGAPAGQ
ncbi:MAG TPA: FKBP-type peptidyl-prolyl cis-trans isomerase [Sphingomonas sp.]|jgi:hypothetical protein